MHSRGWLGLGTLAALAAIALLPGKVSVWVDGDGRTILSNAEEPPSEGAVELPPEALAVRWRGRWTEPPARKPPAAAVRDPVLRDLLTARDDIERGERHLALQTLRRLHAEHPGRPEVGWLLAWTERERGRLEAAQSAVDVTLGAGSAMAPAWRERIAALGEQIESDRQHAEEIGQGHLRVENGVHFRLTYDHPFAGRAYGDVVLASLEMIRTRLEQSLGRVLDEKLEVHLYTRAEYLKSYAHKFGFSTVGFYDGVIHVVASRRPQPRLLALLTHEYSHALFLDALGSHRPFFLNEGIAEREEDRIRGRTRLSRGDWRRLLDAVREGRWIPLQQLIGGFAGLDGSRALLAYLESRVAIEHLEASHPGAVAGWLGRCAGGEAWEAALVSETDWSVDALDAELRREVRSRFVEVDLD